MSLLLEFPLAGANATIPKSREHPRLRQRSRIYERDFSEDLKTIAPEKHENFMIRQGEVLAGEYLYGDLSDSEELQPWD